MQNKITIICIIALLSPIFAIGQTTFFSTLWSEKYQHTDTDLYSNEMRKIAVDTVSGNVYTLADFTSDMDMNGIVTGSTYHYVGIIVTDELGQSVNGKIINVGMHHTSGFDAWSGFGLELDAAGNIYVGYTSYDPTTDFDINISKLNSNLDILWNYKYNPVSDELGIDLKVTGSGQAYAIVKSTSNMTNIRHRVIKATGAGTSAVPFYNFNSAPDYLKSLALDNSGNIYTTGYRLLQNVKSIVTASITSTGTLRWIRADNCGTVSGDDVGNHITVGSDGFVYFTGMSVGTLQHGIDVVTMKLNSANGKKVWENFIHNSLTDGGYFIDATDQDFAHITWTADNIVYVDQIFKSNGLQGRRAAYAPIPVSPYSNLDGVVVNDMLMTSGKNIYVAATLKAYSPSAQQFSTSFLIAVNFSSRGASRIVLETPAEGDFNKSLASVAVAADESRKQVYHAHNIFGSYSSHDQEWAAITCYKSSGIFRTGDSQLSTSEISIFPSPAISHITIDSEEQIYSVEIFSVTGQLVLESKINNNQIRPTIDVSQLTTGIYFAKVQFMDETFKTLKLVKE